MNTIDIREEATTDIQYITFAEPRRDGDNFGNRLDLCGNDGVLYIDENDGGGDTLRIHKDDIDNLILALKRAKELLK